MQLWLNCVTKDNKMAKLIIKSYQSRGWLVPIIGENFQKITNYCSENGEDVEWFCPNTNEETYQEIIEDFDVYDAALDAEDYALSSTSIVVDDNCTISLLQDGNEIPLSFDQVVVEKTNITVADFIKDKKEYMSEEELENFNGRAYAFGYTSNDIIEVELKVCTCDEEFDPKKLVFQNVNNEFFEDVGEYITGIEYRDEYLETGDLEDIDGDYFNSVSFKVE